MVKRPVSSVYNLMMGVTFKNSSFERIQGIGSSGEIVVGGLGLVDLTPCRFLEKMSHDCGGSRWTIFSSVGECQPRPRRVVARADRF